MMTVCCATVSGPYPCQQKVRHIVDGRGYCEGHWRHYQQEYEQKTIREAERRIVEEAKEWYKELPKGAEPILSMNASRLAGAIKARLALEPPK